jgi:hypothetical protein
MTVQKYKKSTQKYGARIRSKQVAKVQKDMQKAALYQKSKVVSKKSKVAA